MYIHYIDYGYIIFPKKVIGNIIISDNITISTGSVVVNTFEG